MRTIQLDIAVDGNYHVTAIGYSGPSCLEATKKIEEALGTVSEGDRVLSNDYHDLGFTTVEAAQQQTC